MRTIEEIEVELGEVNAAIRAIVTGAQSYDLGTRSVTKADLSQLRALRTELMSELGDAEGGGVRLITWAGR